MRHITRRRTLQLAIGSGTVLQSGCAPSDSSVSAEVIGDETNYDLTILSVASQLAIAKGVRFANSIFQRLQPSCRFARRTVRCVGAEISIRTSD
jgi:hypothetical protein